VRFDTVGKPPPGVEIRIGDGGEILVRSRSVFKGYHNAPEQTAKVLDGEGWLRTGDAGYLRDDGELVYLDRVSDLVKLSTGEPFSPQYIEGRLKFSAFIQDVMTVGSSDTPFVSAIVNIEFDNVARWAEQHRISFTTFVDLSQQPEVYQLIRQDIERVNASLPPAGRIKRFIILHKAFDPDEAELTRTRKLRRRFLEQRYGSLLRAIYEGKDEVEVRAEVKYRDGRTGVAQTTIRIMTLDTA
jgi:long-chain acyl-CoA synthetase